MNPIDQFNSEKHDRIVALSADAKLQEQSREWVESAMEAKYVYNFSWLGRPIIQFPQDMVALQELIWAVKPDLIIETGIAHGGSLVFSASMLALLDVCEAFEEGKALDPRASSRKVIGIDIEIRSHNRHAINEHPLSDRIMMIEGSSIDLNIVEEVKAAAKGYQRVLVCLDSMHTHDHVLAELEAYADLVTPGSYCVVFDTFVEDMPDNMFPDRPWSVGDNPKTAVWDFLQKHSDFVIDKSIQHKLQITAAPDGYLKRISS